MSAHAENLSEVEDQARQTFSLDERYDLPAGVVLLSGIQALVRGLQTRARLDAEAGIKTGGFVSGYRGSPLGGLDKELWSETERLQASGIHFQPGVNEDLAATAVWGSQQVGLHAGARVDGVFGLWYGKAPGLDRSCDAIRHANAWGTSPHGGVLLVVGDDPAAKSSSLATQSEFALQDMMVPVLAPADIQDVLDFSVLGWQMSRYSGLWVGLKALADHMDGTATVLADPQRYRVVLPDGGNSAADVHIRREDTPVDQEIRLAEAKLPAALEFARAAGINRWVTPRKKTAEKAEHKAEQRAKARLGIIAAGKAYRDVREGLAHFGLHTVEEIAAAGIELVKLGMTWPLDPALVTQLAQRVDHILVAEEKRAFVEPQVKDLLYGLAAAGQAHVPVSGKLLAGGAAGLPATGTLAVHDVVRVIAQLLQLQAPALLQESELARARVSAADAPARKERTPLFCAGCPHNTSTRVPSGSRATAGIGCHYMVQWMDRNTDSCTQMGGEGVTWVGEAPFTDEQHIFANLGDGTYFHSGLLAIRQAVAAGVNITYKILYNDAVAMTGGQPTDGELRVADVVRQVRAEGVARVVVVSDDPQQQREELQQQLENPVSVMHRDDLDEVQQGLRNVAGVTVLIYQQTCATELRRRRKRGLVEDTKPRLLINPAVCDGCGDCTAQSNCVAVEPVETAHGVKRKINQTICNKDLSCAKGYCPAFVEVSGARASGAQSQLSLPQLRGMAPAPELAAERGDILITGVGGTGIVTLSALLAAAAKLDGKHVQTLDMTGLAQKGGAVFGHVRIAETLPHTGRIVSGGADVVVGCDLVSAASNEALALLSADTRVVLNTHVAPTAEFVLSQSNDTHLRKRLGRVRKAAQRVDTCDAEDICNSLLGSSLQANVLLLGFAYQQGRIPVSLAALEEAVRLNGVAVEQNLQALHLGRLAACDPQRVAELRGHSAAPVEQAAPQHAQLAELISFHAENLAAYADDKLAEKYRALVASVAAREQQVRSGSEQLTRAAAESYARVLAVKDEWEVARLHLQPEFTELLSREFAPGARTTYLLAPPLLGVKKRRFGAWMKGVFKVLANMKGLRNTALDPFRFSSERRRSLFYIRHYEELLQQILPHVDLQNLPIAVALARLPQEVRGFGHVRERQLQAALQKEQHLLEEFHRPPAAVQLFDPGQQAA